MLEDQPDLDVIIVPIGGGSGAAGACIATHGVNPDIRVIGVQAEAAPAAYRSWQQRALSSTHPAAPSPRDYRPAPALPCRRRILWDQLHDFVLVSDDEILQAMAWMVELAHTLAEIGRGRAAGGGLPHERRAPGQTGRHRMLRRQYLARSPAAGA